MRVDKIIGYIGLLGLALLFALWAFANSSLPFAGTAMAVVSLVLFGWLGLNLTPRLTLFLKGEEELKEGEELGKRSSRRSYRHPWVKIAFAILLWQAAVYTLSFIYDLNMHGYDGGLLDKLYDIWVKGDAPHYLGLAENGYVTQGDPRFHIVFYPLYPLCIKAVWFFVRDYFTAALIVSNISAIVSGILLYELTLLDTERKTALRSVKFLFLIPAAFFFAAPMSESLFFMLSLGCIYLARKKKFFFACAAGGLAAFTRSLGVLLLVPVLMEMIAELVRSYKNNASFWRHLLSYALSLLLIAAGTFAYLAINYAVWGNPWQFLIFQKEHWSQGMGLFFSTASYQTENILKCAQDLPQLFGLWLPNVLAMILSLCIMIPAAKRLRASYTAYFFVYFFVAMGATWLLSAPRYLAFCFPLSLALTALTRNKKADVFATILCVALFALYLGAHVAGWHVY